MQKRQKSINKKDSAEKVVRNICRKTQRKFSTDEKISIVPEGLRGQESNASLCRREGIAESLYYSWSREFLEGGKKRLAGDAARQAIGDEDKSLRAVTCDFKEGWARQIQENRLLKKA